MKRLFFLLLLSASLIGNTQTLSDTTALRSYINSWILPNGARIISAKNLNTIFNGFLNTYPFAGKDIDSSSWATRYWASQNFVSLSGAYVNPSWITSLDYSKLTGPFVVPNLITAPTGAIPNGYKYINTTTNTEETYINGAWRKALFNGDVGYITGKVITVDKDAVNATDNRGTISKYNSFYPFKTIAAAAAVMVSGDVLRVESGVYTNDSLVINTPQLNTVYMDGVTFTGSIKMSGYLFLTKTILNSYIYLYYTGSDFASGNIIAGLDKGSSVINGKIEMQSAPGATYLTVRHLGRITTPATGYNSGWTITGTSNLQVIVDGINKIENQGTATGIFRGGSFNVSNVGEILTPVGYNGNMFTGNPRFYNVNLVYYRGTGVIAGGFSSGLAYAENTTFKVDTATYMFATYSGGESRTFKNCKFISTKTGGYFTQLSNNPSGAAQNKSFYLYDCHFQFNNNSGANYLFNVSTGNDLLNFHFINCISNQNTTIPFSRVDATPVINIVSNYINNPAFVIQTTPIFN